MIYIFHREGMFYPLELGSDEEAVANAQCNPGTLKVTLPDGQIVWPLPEHRQ